MNVLMLPYSPGNPYQDLLADELAARGFAVNRLSKVFFLTNFFAMRAPRIVHLHWIEPWYIRHGKIPGIFRFAAFALQIAVLKLFRTPIVWTVHNLSNHEEKNLRLEKYAYSLVCSAAQRVIVHCQYASDKLKTRLPAAISKPEKIQVVPHGNYIGAYPNTVSRQEARSRLRIDPGDFVLLSLGAVRPYKGPVELINSIRGLQVPAPVKLVIAGRAHQESAKDEVESAAQNETQVLFFPGFVAKDDVQVFMNAADIFVAPFRDVLTSGSVILALSFGKAVIAPNLGCLPEVLGKAADFLYDPREPDGLKRAIESAIQRRAELSALGSKARSVAEHLCWSNIARLTAECYSPNAAR